MRRRGRATSRSRDSRRRGAGGGRAHAEPRGVRCATPLSRRRAHGGTAGVIGRGQILVGELPAGRGPPPHRELIALPGGGALIATPGMRELQLWAGEDAVDRAFDEVATRPPECRYRDCTHSGEPGFAVESALADGALAPDRWESYRKLRGEAQRHEAMADPLLALERKRKWKRIHKAARDIYKSPKHR